MEQRRAALPPHRSNENQRPTMQDPSAENIVRQKCIAAGIPSRDYMSTWARFGEQVEDRYNDLGYTAEWRAWKTATLLWDHFFRPEQFPGKMPRVYPATLGPSKEIIPRLQIDSAPIKNGKVDNGPRPQIDSARIRDGKVDTTDFFESPTKAYAWQGTIHQLMKAKAKELGITAESLNSVFKEKKAIADQRFQSENADWRIWYTESLVWSHFFKDSPFPGEEPARTYHLSADDVAVKSLKSVGSSRDKWVKTPFASDQRSEPSTRASAMQYPPHPKVPTIKATNIVTPIASSSTDLPLYQNLEKVMEQKAVALGIRSEFFQLLQKNRDVARYQHEKCDRGYRAWLADSMTWDHFFSRDYFPGKEPVGDGVHHYKCPKYDQIFQPCTVPHNPNTVLKNIYSNGVQNAQRHRSSSSTLPATSHDQNSQPLGPASQTFALGNFARKGSYYRPSSSSLPTAALPKQTSTRQPLSSDSRPSATGHLTCRVLINGISHDFSRSFPKPVFDKFCSTFAIHYSRHRAFEEPLGCTIILESVPSDGYSRRLRVEPRRWQTPREQLVGSKNGFDFLQSFVDNMRKVLNSSGDVDDENLSLWKYWHTYSGPGAAVPSLPMQSQAKSVSQPQKAETLPTAPKASPTMKIDSSRRRDLSQDMGRLLFHGAFKQHFDCSDVAVKGFAYVILIDKHKFVVEDALRCEIKSFERKRDTGDGLTIQVSSIAESPTSRSDLERATKLVLSWIKNGILSGEPGKLYSYWQAWIGAKPSIPDEPKEEEPRTVDSGAQTEDCALLPVCAPPEPKAHIALGDPETDWERYAEAFGATEVDRVLIEEQAKAEGSLRLVLDRQTQDIISLAEFEGRTRLMCLAAQGPAVNQANKIIPEVVTNGEVIEHPGVEEVDGREEEVVILEPAIAPAAIQLEVEASPGRVGTKDEVSENEVRVLADLSSLLDVKFSVEVEESEVKTKGEEAEDIGGDSTLTFEQEEKEANTMVEADEESNDEFMTPEPEPMPVPPKSAEVNSSVGRGEEKRKLDSDEESDEKSARAEKRARHL